mgnify:CR=1 FL=1
MADHKKPTLPPREWRGSMLAQDIVTHHDGTPTLEIVYRARIPLHAGTVEQVKERGQKLSATVKDVLSSMKTVDKLQVRSGKALRNDSFKGRKIP